MRKKKNNRYLICKINDQIKSLFGLIVTPQSEDLIKMPSFKTNLNQYKLNVINSASIEAEELLDSIWWSELRWQGLFQGQLSAIRVSAISLCHISATVPLLMNLDYN